MSLTDALTRVDGGADEQWKSAVDVAIDSLAKKRRTFTTDDVWDIVNEQGVFTPEARAMGPRIISAKKRGVIEQATCNHCGTKKIVHTSKFVHSHARHVVILRSLVYGT